MSKAQKKAAPKLDAQDEGRNRAFNLRALKAAEAVRRPTKDEYDRVAAKFDISVRSISRARRVLRDGSREQVEAVRAGTLSLYDATLQLQDTALGELIAVQEERLGEHDDRLAKVDERLDVQGATLKEHGQILKQHDLGEHRDRRPEGTSGAIQPAGDLPTPQFFRIGGGSPFGVAVGWIVWVALVALSHFQYPTDEVLRVGVSAGFFVWLALAAHMATGRYSTLRAVWEYLKPRNIGPVVSGAFYAATRPFDFVDDFQSLAVLVILPTVWWLFLQFYPEPNDIDDAEAVQTLRRHALLNE